jgi:hypothetical protein
VGGRLNESEQIGRRRTIDELERICLNGNSALIFDKRRVGKSSVAWAVVERARARNEIGIDIDLREIDVVDGVDRLADMIRAAVEHLPALRRTTRRARDISTVPVAQGLASVLKMFGARDEGEALQLIHDQLTTLQSRPSLAGALNAAENRAQLQQTPALVLLDEIHLLAEYEGTARAQADLAAAMQRHGRLVFIFAGSDGRAVEELFSKGKPMYRDGLAFPLPEIPEGEWEIGLTERFNAVGLSIEPNVIRQILAITEGHPQRTMAICAQAVACGPAVAVDTAIIRLAHKRAKAQPSWSS